MDQQVDQVLEHLKKGRADESRTFRCGPKYVVKKGKTPVWSREDAKTLLDLIPKDSVSGLRELGAYRRDVLQLRPCERRTAVYFWAGKVKVLIPPPRTC
jgi:hypothetical protein